MLHCITSMGRDGSGMSDFSLRYCQPSAMMRECVYAYYILESDLPAWADNLRAELPQMRFMWRGDVQVSFAGLPELAMPRASLSGPSSAAIHFRARGPIRMCGAGLLPAGWAALIGSGASDLADLPLDLEQLAGLAARRTLHQVAEAKSDQECAAALDAFFLSLAMKARQPPLWFTRATDSWLSGSRNPDVNQLVQTLGMSSRQIERMALRVYGASPKLLARKYRAVHAAIRLGRNPEAGWEHAAAGVYYDQPHFIRDFRRFIGMTPGDYARREAGSLIRLTVTER